GANVNRLDIVTDPHRVLSDEQIAQVDALLARRLNREPISHITGRKGFWKHEFTVSAEVLTPRPDTELVVETGLALLPADKPARILDFGIGSGAILLALLHDRPLAKGVGVDKSPAALAMAGLNTVALGLSERVELIQGDWGEGLEGR